MSGAGSSGKIEHLFGMDMGRLEGLVADLGEPRYRARQIFKWLYVKGVSDPEGMTDLPARVRRALADRVSGFVPGLVETHPAGDGSVKLLFELGDGALVEGVLLPGTPGQRTLCVSSQVGCALGCTFCRTGQMGLVRNLSVNEILGQVLQARRYLESGERPRWSDEDQGPARLTRLVFMGMGEPLMNLPNLVRSIRLLMGPEAMGFGPGRVTVSTAGLPRQMLRLREQVQVRLAVSLGGSTEAQRKALMPGAHRIASLGHVLATCRKIPLGSRERITFEYVMVAGVNDSDQDAHRLVAKTKGIRCKLNLIPLNVHPGTDLAPSSTERMRSFQKILVNRGRPTSIRRSLGSDELAACGQLATGIPNAGR